jgi:hypothetical protein
LIGNKKAAFCSGFEVPDKPSDGLEPATPSLPFWGPGNWSQPSATVFACLSRFRGRSICHRLPPVATAGLHKRSIPRRRELRVAEGLHALSQRAEGFCAAACWMVASASLSLMSRLGRICT